MARHLTPNIDLPLELGVSLIGGRHYRRRLASTCYKEPARDGSVDESHNLRDNCVSHRKEVLPQAIGDYFL